MGTRVKRVALLSVALVCLYVLAALLGAMIPSRRQERSTAFPQHDILLLSGPIHYDILLPLNQAVRERFDFAQNAGLALDQPLARWLVVGWGAQDFYTSTGTYGDVEARAVLRGIFGDRSVMRLDLAGDIPIDVSAHPVSLTPGEFNRLLDAIAGSFTRDGKGNPLPLATNGLSGTDAFFVARGNFNLLNTCNVWVGKMLRAAGLEFGFWTPLPMSVRLSHALYLAP